MAEKTLSDRHFQELWVGSGIDEEVIKARGYYTETEKGALAALKFGGRQRKVPALVLPLYRPDGRVGGHQIKPDSPRVLGKRHLKYEWPHEIPPIVDCPPTEFMLNAIQDPKQPLVITEGSKKADAAVSHGVPCVALAGVWNWRGTNQFGGKVSLPDLDMIAWEHHQGKNVTPRKVYICYDNDVADNNGVYSAMVRLAGLLTYKGANVNFIILPPGDKLGLDDFFVQGGDANQLWGFSQAEPPRPPREYYAQNDYGMAQRVLDNYAEEVIYDNDHNLWYVWDTNRWVIDRKGVIVRAKVASHATVLREEAQGMCDEQSDKEALKKQVKFMSYANMYGNSTRVRGTEEMLQSLAFEQEPGWDEKPEMLNCANGTLDLVTGEFHQSNPHDRLTVVCPTKWVPGADCPTWLKFMAERFPNTETRAFIQRVCGMFVTGKTTEKAFFVVRGDKDCGKTKWVEAMQTLLGAYANKVQKNTLMRQKDKDKQATMSEELRGRRMIFVDENEAGDKIDDSFIKDITGGESTLKSRKLYEQERTSKVQFTLVLTTNYKPRITGDDEAIWRRCHLIEFGKPIPEENQIGDFLDVLLSESEGILQWMVDGYRDWKQIGGLRPPEEVQAWTHAYQMDNNPMGRFIDECYDINLDGEFEFVGDVHMHFLAWCNDQGINLKQDGLKTQAKFAQRMRDKYPSTGDSLTVRRVQNKRVLEGMKMKGTFRDTSDMADSDFDG